MNNVTNVQCKPDPGTTSNKDASTSEKTAQTEFLAMTEINLRDGTILTMSDLQAAYSWQYSWSKQSPRDRTVRNRKTLQQLIQILIPEVEFHRPPKVNESDRLSIKNTHDAAIHLIETKGILTIQNKWKYCLKLHSCYERQSIAARNGCFQWLASTNFLSVPRSLFAPDGKMLHCSAKSALMKLLEKFSAWWRIRAKNDHWSSD